MKKNLLCLFTLCFLLPSVVLANGNVLVEKTNINLMRGSKKYFKIELVNAAGRVDIMSENNDVASIDKNSVFLDKNNTYVTVTGNKIGHTRVKVLAYDVSTYDLEVLNGSELYVDVNVFERGDVNFNNIIDLNDVMTILRKYLGLLMDDEIDLYDVNLDDDINLFDVQLIIQKYLNID